MSNAVVVDVPDSAAVYSPAALAIYDLWVLRMTCSMLWRCPVGQILALYDEYAGPEHLDVGVGTGWYLNNCSFRQGVRRIELMDINEHALARAARRVTRLSPRTHRCDVMRPIRVSMAPVDSCGLVFVWHCLAGSADTKATVFDNLIPLIRPGGVLYGATVLGKGVRCGLCARLLMKCYNRRRIFSNMGDDAEGLARVLRRRFESVEVVVRGTVALFTAWKAES